MKYTIREVQVYDLRAVADIKRMHRACFPYDSSFEPKIGHWWIAYHAGEPVGFAGMKLSSRWIDCGYLWRSGVLADHRGRGLQVRFIKARERKARQLGWKYLITDTSDNPSSANNLIKCGFTIYDPSIEYGFRHTVYWRKAI